MPLSVDHVKVFIKAAAQLANAGAGVMEDGEVTLGDFFRHGKGLIAAVKGLTTLDYNAVVPEIKDLDDADKAELAALFNATFDLKSESVEAMIESGVDIMLDAIQGLVALLALVSKVKVKPIAA